MAAGLIVSLIGIATLAGVLAFRGEEDLSARRSMVRSIAYWLLTVLLAFELAAGALWDLLRIEYVRVALTQLGYPLYLLVILGVWRIHGALVLLAPRFPRLKEWVYDGAFFRHRCSDLPPPGGRPWWPVGGAVHFLWFHPILMGSTACSSPSAYGVAVAGHRKTCNKLGGSDPYCGRNAGGHALNVAKGRSTTLRAAIKTTIIDA